VQLRVVTDQPWDVAADVLVIPFVGEPSFEGEVDELDRRSGGELRALAEVRELRTRRWTTAMTRGGHLPARWLVTVSAGAPEEIDRETTVHVAATAERRLAGRVVHSMAVWLSPFVGASGFDGDAATAAELVARGVVEGSYDPKALYRPEIESRPPQLDELILVAPGGDKAAIQAAGERGVIMGEGANTARTLGNRARTRCIRRSSPRRRAPSPSATACGSTSSTRSAPPSSAWACSWPSAGGRTTRRG
jgi:leucyl aminopeptidase